jgi:hypothetical protein
MTGVFKSDGWAARFVANESITLGNIVYLNDDGKAMQGTAAQKERAVGPAIGGDYVGKSGTEGVVASGNGVTVAFKGMHLVTASEAIQEGQAVQGADSGKVAVWDEGAGDKVLGFAVSGATGDGETLKVVF